MHGGGALGFLQGSIVLSSKSLASAMRVATSIERNTWRRGILGEKERHSRLSPHLIMVANQIGRQRRQLINFPLGPTVFNRPVHALDIAGLFQAPVLCGRK